MSLTEANGFHNNRYGKATVNVKDDMWNISNINIPITDSYQCYLYIHLSNNDYCGYRRNHALYHII